MAVKNNPISMKESVKDPWVSMKKHRVSVKALPRDGRDRMPDTRISPLLDTRAQYGGLPCPA